jgi:hypothetical protein
MAEMTTAGSSFWVRESGFKVRVDERFPALIRLLAANP